VRCPRRNGVLDTVFDAVDRFQPSREGDSIVVLTLGVESNHRVDYTLIGSDLDEEKAQADVNAEVPGNHKSRVARGRSHRLQVPK
jgi:hypothetical protein